MPTHGLILNNFRDRKANGLRKWPFYTYGSLAKNMPCNREVSVMAKKAFPMNIGETWGRGQKWDTQLADNAYVVMRQTQINLVTASADTLSHLGFLELRTGRMYLSPLSALSFVHCFAVLCSNLPSCLFLT